MVPVPFSCGQYIQISVFLGVKENDFSLDIGDIRPKAET